MANIRVDLPSIICNGQTITFKSPSDCSEVTGLKVYYQENGKEKFEEFTFADAHGNNVGDIDLFSADVMVKVILDTELHRAYVQNADTNAYLEKRLSDIKGWKTIADVTLTKEVESADVELDENLYNFCEAIVVLHEFSYDHIKIRVGNTSFAFTNYSTKSTAVYIREIFYIPDLGGHVTLEGSSNDYENFGFKSGEIRSIKIVTNTNTPEKFKGRIIVLARN